MSAADPNSGPTSSAVALSGPLTIAELLDRTFRALRARFGVLILSAAIVIVPLGVLTALLTGRFLTGYFDLLQFMLTEPESADLVVEEFLGDFLGYFGAIIFIALCSVIGTTLVTLMSTYHIERFLNGASSTVGDALRLALRRLLPMIWMQILQFLAIGFVTGVVATVVAVGIFIVALIFGGAMAGLGDSPASIVLMIGLIIALIVGYLLLIVLILTPTILFSARWVAAGPSLVIEYNGPIESLQRSWRLTQGRFWRCIIYVVLLAIFSAVVISLPLALTQQIAMVLAPSQVTLIMAISTVAGYLLNLLYQPFYATGIVLFYYDLRVRAEAYDVALRVAALEAELAPDAPST